MNHEKFEHDPESAKKATFTPPAVESFLDPAQAGTVWPENIASNKEFLKQLEERKKLNEQLDGVLSCLPQPDMSLKEAISQGHLTETQVAELYTSLTQLLGRDSDYKRIALYIPFEFLPNTEWKPSSKGLTDAAEQFRTAYMESWNSLLSVHDVRANFVNGDVLEVESRKGDLPRVVKAAHLIPKLVENGMITTEDVIQMIEKNRDQTLKHSIADTLPVLTDLGFIKDAELDRMEKSGDSVLRNTAILMASESMAKAEATEPEEITLSYLHERLQSEFGQIDSEKYEDVTKKREVWLKSDKKEKAIESTGNNINSAIAEKTFTNESATQFITPEADVSCQQALIDGIRKAIESTAQSDAGQAQELYASYQDTLLSLWKSDRPEIREGLSKTFCRLHGLGIVDDQQLRTLGMTIPELAGPLSKNLESISEEMSDIKKMTAAIESDPALSQSIYPAVLVFGSRLKGYGTESADIVKIRLKSSKK